ncbi:hypothetical protein EDD11_010370 [Mortierella claussenii]|nr:hypothetical protein EDD11_010370 [Mortierella claussenii]
MAICAGGLFIGSQFGLVLGLLSSIKTVQSIPNFQRVLKIIQEVREEDSGQGGAGAIEGAGHDRAATMPSAGHQRFPVQQRRSSELMTDSAVEQQSQGFSEFKNGDGYHGGNDPNGAARLGQQSDHTAWSQVAQRAKELQNTSSSWNQIRQENLPKSAWNDIRQGRRPSRGAKNDDDVEGDNDVGAENDDDPKGEQRKGSGTNSSSRKSAGSAWDRVRRGGAEGGFVSSEGAPDGPSDFARTREDLESKPSHQKNQYGDAL